MDNKRLKVVFISFWYPHKLKPLNGIFVKRHAVANAIDCDVSAIFVCSDKSYSIEESVEDGVYTIRGYYKAPGLKIPLFYQLVKLFRYLLMWKKVWTMYKNKNGKPDILNSNIVYPVSIIATLVKYSWGVPYVITEHWSGYFPEDGSYRGFTKKLISRIAVANAGAVITDSAKLCRTMPALGLKNKYFNIPNVVDPDMFALKSPGVHSEFNFIHVSSLGKEKNVPGIVRVFKKFHAIHPDTKLNIIWDEESKEFLEKLKEEPFSEELGIFIIGKKTGKELVKLLQQADAFILFSNYENLPCVMLESFSCGLPVIGTRVGDVPEYINEKNGILIEAKNETQLLEAMEKVFANKGKYNPEEIRNMVVNKVSPAAVSKQFTDIYKMVLEPHE